MTFSEQTFAVGGLHLNAKRWGTPGGLPVIALHGWLDNAGSFDFLAPELKGCDLICLDCAGHGKSDRRPHLGAYNVWQDVAEVYAVADYLGWAEFNLVGHSRGAMICFLAAGTFPERIKNLILIEGVFPRTAPPEQAPQILAEAIRSIRLAVTRKRHHYSAFADAVATRTKGTYPVAECDAERLALHGVLETPDGFTWSYDPKLLAGSEVRLTIPQLLAFRDQITAHTLVVLADKGLLLEQPDVLNLFSPNWRVETLKGGHHLHMHEQAHAVAHLINRHFSITGEVFESL